MYNYNGDVMKVLCIGHAAYDFTMPMKEYPKENKKYRVENAVGCGGGPASNAAFLLSSWGIKTYFAGVVGNDENGRKIKEEFKKIKVNTRFLEVDPNNDTTISFIVVNAKNGSRTIFTKRSSAMKLTKEINVKADLILVDGQELEASKKAMENNKNAITVIDAGRVKKETVELAKLVDYVICSSDFAEEYTGIKIDLKDSKCLENIFSKLTSEFKNVIITVEDKGALYQKDGIVKQVPSIRVKQIDSTGAGDIFHGAFCYCLLKKYDIEKCIMISNIAGAISVTRVGGRYSMPSLKEVMSTYRKCLKK